MVWFNYFTRGLLMRVYSLFVISSSYSDVFISCDT